MTTFLRGALPYVAFALLVAGLVRRHRYATYGWTRGGRGTSGRASLAVPVLVHDLGVHHALVVLR